MTPKVTSGFQILYYHSIDSTITAKIIQRVTLSDAKNSSISQGNTELGSQVLCLVNLRNETHGHKSYSKVTGFIRVKEGRASEGDRPPKRDTHGYLVSRGL